MALSEQWIDQLRSRAGPLSALVSRTLTLKRAGREYTACCPFHNEKSPSFYINDEKGFGHCFGCGWHGDHIKWLMDDAGLGFIDAVKALAEEAGMEVPAPSPRAAREAEKRASLHDVTAAAQRWFVDQLASADGTAARAYLATRGFDAHTTSRFGFGYAPENRQSLKAALEQFPEAMLIEAGLRIVVDDKEPYDRFRGRLMLPIEDARGRVIGFGGRILAAGKTDAPKYLNSPDGPLFDKGRTLYNFHRAGPAARKSGRMIVAEGYMDVIALAAAGFVECVAPMGTALTERQIEMLWHVVETPVLCLDGDAAGQRAAMRAVVRALPLLRPARSLLIARLPAGLDPDDLLKRDGRAAMEAVLAGAKGMVDVLWEHERDAAPVASPEAKAGLKARLIAHVETIKDPDIRSLYRRDLLERFSAFAYPPRPPFQKQSGKSGDRNNMSRPPGFMQPPRMATARGAREMLASAILAGLLRFPDQLGRHADALASSIDLDSRLADLIDGLAVAAPSPAEYAGMRFGFLTSAEPARAIEELAQAVELFVVRPALAAAIEAATRRFEQSLSEDDYAEQRRLVARKLEFDERLRALSADHTG